MVKQILYKKIEVLALKTEIFLDELLSSNYSVCK